MHKGRKNLRQDVGLRSSVDPEPVPSKGPGGTKRIRSIPRERGPTIRKAPAFRYRHGAGFLLIVAESGSFSSNRTRGAGRNFPPDSIESRSAEAARQSGPGRCRWSNPPACHESPQRVVFSADFEGPVLSLPASAKHCIQERSEDGSKD